MDRIDADIIELLQRDARRTQQDIAQRVGLSQPSVAERIRKIEERGLIVGYAARVDARRLGHDVTAFVGVGISHPKHFEAFQKAIAALPEVLEAHRVAGRDSYLLKVKVPDTGALDALLCGRIRLLQGVTRTETTIALMTLKEDTFVPVVRPAEEGRI